MVLDGRVSNLGCMVRVWMVAGCLNIFGCMLLSSASPLSGQATKIGCQASASCGSFSVRSGEETLGLGERGGLKEVNGNNLHL